jgi:omega-hydroxy-beta-dihydromenaquinone-9 sulfotransferase
LRAWTLYHPIIISRLWLSALVHSEKYKDKKILSIKFEDLISNPKKTIIKTSKYCEFDFNDHMLKVPQIGSSIGQDNPNILGIDKNKLNTWKNENISKTELYLLQKIVYKKMTEYGYRIEKIKPNYFYLLYLYCIFPLKFFIAILFNLGRMNNIFETLKRRIQK